MRLPHTLICAFIAAGALALAGCNNGSSSPPTPNAAVAGEYSGTITDSVAGSQPATTTLSQHSTSIGGTLTIGTGATASTMSIAWTVSGSALGGSGLMDVNGSTCAFSMSGTYASNQITGKYTAAQGCTGRSGTFTLAQTCVDPVESSARKAQDLVPAC